MGTDSPRPVVLDAGALIQLERGHEYMRALVRRARREQAQLTIPAGALGQVWRDGSRQARLAALLRVRTTTVAPLDAHVARAAGRLCGLMGTSDVIDASVVLEAKRRDAVVVTSDADDLRRLDPGVQLVTV